MGCGSSSTAVDPNNNKKQNEEQDKKDKKDKDGLKQEPEIEDVDVPKTEAGYPAVRPPNDKKANIFFPSKLERVDAHARQTPAEKADSYQGLISYLIAGCSSDVEKLRAIFVWIGSQGIDDADYSDVTDSDSPRGFMKLMKAHRASYSSFFAVLCRHAGLSCVIISGFAKSVGYKVGDSDEKVKQLNNSWNAVYVAGGWRLVFPLWACRAVVGHATGSYTKVETKGQAVREKEVQSKGVTVMQLNEYYFLTDPEDFIFIAYPADERWQLLSRPWSFQKFGDVPHCRQTYFKENVNITSKFSGRLKTVDGICNVELTCDDLTNMSMDYELYYNHEESGKEISSSLQLNNFVFLNRSDSKWNYGIRFPEAGVYKLEITGGRGYETDVCYFKIHCDVAQEDCKPLPVNPGSVGYGPSSDTELAGLNAMSHKNGLVKVSANKQIEFNFNLTRIVSVQTELVHTTLSKEQLQSCVKQTQTNKKLNVIVTVPEKGEYALQLHTQQKGETSYKNVCNYLLTSDEGKKKRTRAYENPTEKNARSKVKAMSNSKGTKESDIDDLQTAISRFEKLDLDDKGDLSTAQEALEFKKIQKELHDAINRRHLETLEKAIDHGKESRFKDKLATSIKDAESLRDHLKHLNRIAHDILEMKQPTIAELKSYNLPRPIIYEIMRATFVMLGERKEHTQDWEDIKILMGKTGKESMLRKVKNFDTVNVQPDTTYYVNKVLIDHTETDARLASAGAGTFYVWLRNVSSHISDKEDAPA